MRKFKDHLIRLLKLCFLLFLIIIAFIYAMFQGGFVSWFLLASLFPFVLYGILLFFYPLRNFTVEREFNQSEYSAGERIEITIKLRRENWFPLFFLLVEDLVPPKLKRQTGHNFKFILHPFFKREIVYKYSIHRISRGEYCFDKIRLKTGDLLTFMEKEALFSKPKKVLVYPAYVDMAYRPFENQFEFGMTATKDKVQRDSTMSISVREYEPGDRFSWIHWKASARKNDLMTKEFEQKQTHDIMLVLDRTSNQHFDLAVTFGASVIRAVLHRGAEVGLLSYGKKKEYFPSQRGDFQLRRLFYYLATVEDDSTVVFSKILESESMKLQQNQILMVVVNELRFEDVNVLSALSTKRGQSVIFVIKAKGERISDKEFACLQQSRGRGIITKIVYEGEFSAAFEREDW